MWLLDAYDEREKKVPWLSLSPNGPFRFGLLVLTLYLIISRPFFGDILARLNVHSRRDPRVRYAFASHRVWHVEELHLTCRCIAKGFNVQWSAEQNRTRRR